MSQHTDFRKLIEHTFSSSEIRQLCFDIQLDYDELPGDRKSAKVIALLLATYKAEKLEELVHLLAQERPKANWPLIEEIKSYDWESISQKVDLPQKVLERIGEIIKKIEKIGKIADTLRRKDQPSVWNGKNPYLGLKAYQQGDSEFFYGREDLVDSLLGRIEQSNLITIVGASGSGKSSLARAGLLHALNCGRLEKSDTWLLGTMTPKNNPKKELVRAISRVAKSPDAGEYIEDNWDKPRALKDQINSLLSDDKRQYCVLLIDQFEEIITQEKDSAENKTFINQLTHAIDGDGRLKIVLTIRLDFVPKLSSEYPTFQTLANKQVELVGAMNEVELTRAITLPAYEVGASIEHRLVGKIVSDMKGQNYALPLMSFALRDLFDSGCFKESKTAELTLIDYLDRGGLGSALETHANGVLEALSDSQRELARNIFPKLIEIGQGSQDTKRTASFSELVPVGRSTDEVREVLLILAAEGTRLIAISDSEHESKDGFVIDSSAKREETIALTHESLINDWPWLRKLIDENRELISIQNHLASEASTWKRSGMDRGYLFMGGRLTSLEERLPELEAILDELSAQFVQASIDQKNAEIAKIEADKVRELNQAKALAQAESTRAEEVSKSANRLRLIISIIAIIAAIGPSIWLRQELFKFRARSSIVSDERNAENACHINLRVRNLVETDLTFDVEMHEVTNWQYMQCVNSGNCGVPVNPKPFLLAERCNHPVVNVSAYQADNYCNWLGRRLPTNKEWELASKLTLKVERDESRAFESTSPVIDSNQVTFQGYNKIYGLDDNVREWTSTLVDPIPNLKQDGSMIEWELLEAEFGKDIGFNLIVRGGSFKGDYVNGRTEYVQHDFNENVGFRCVQNSE